MHTDPMRPHNWMVVARTARGTIEQWRCFGCQADAYGVNPPIEVGCPGPTPSRLHDATPVLNRTHTRDNF